MPRFWPRRGRSEISTPAEVDGLVNVGRSIGSKKVAQQDGFHGPKEQLDLESSLETFEGHADLVGARCSARPNGAMQRAIIVRRLQRDYGTRYVQMLFEYNSRRKAAGLQTADTVGPPRDNDERKTV